MDKIDKSKVSLDSSSEIDPIHGENLVDEQVLEEVEKTTEIFAKQDDALFGIKNTSWTTAADVVKKIVPVPRLFWKIIHSVYGTSGEVKEVDPMTFSVLENLILKAVDDKDLITEIPPGGTLNLTKAVSALGSDVAASLCFVYSLSRRVSKNLNERIFRAIMDDALLRARLGVVLGREAPQVGIGKALLAGFTGRAGLAVQLASGSEEQAKIALSGLATGKDISKVCYEVYGCDSLQVAALSLVAGGVSKDIALGVSAFSAPVYDVVGGSEQYRWLVLFTILENLRLNKVDAIPESYWGAIGVNGEKKESIIKSTQKVYRSGHKFNWILSPLTAMGDTSGIKKDRDEVFQSLP